MGVAKRALNDLPDIKICKFYVLFKTISFQGCCNYDNSNNGKSGREFNKLVLFFFYFLTYFHDRKLST